MPAGNSRCQVLQVPRSPGDAGHAFDAATDKHTDIHTRQHLLAHLNLLHWLISFTLIITDGLFPSSYKLHRSRDTGLQTCSRQTPQLLAVSFGRIALRILFHQSQQHPHQNCVGYQEQHPSKPQHQVHTPPFKLQHVPPK